MPNVNKPVIPAEVADALVEARKHHNEADLFQPHAFDSHSEHYDGILGRWVYASDENLRDYFTALINGYERELTEEQRKHDALREAYFDLLGTEFASGINYALTTLGVAVSGVNAE
ncbi:hypothetical protein [Paenibacillus polymyxa]|uniref:hypothetical protein n=1 Tax=Paenibacillus polymyxa TaxID=1406 RepID=UPI0018691228|nr:hypothetical protein [Paenibacillus polymyxa]MBE3649141.1 DUF1642 domain-containing protein [Paenibacillus polymyxa]